VTASRAGDCRFRLAAYLHYHPLYGLMSSRYHRVIAINAHIVGEGLHLTSVTQLSGHSCPAAHPPLTRFRANGSHYFLPKRGGGGLCVLFDASCGTPMLFTPSFALF
jgi:hypothetical protein